MANIKLKLFTVPVAFADGSTAEARAEGNNAAWHCRCIQSMPLLGRSYFHFGQDCHTVCPDCGRIYRVHRDANKKTQSVEEIT